MTSLHIIVEDTEGDAVGVSIYNFPTALGRSSSYFDSLFPVGTVIVIREPTYKDSTRDSPPFIRVDTPTDAIFLSPGNGLGLNVDWIGPRLPNAPSFPTSPELWKTLGNSLFKKDAWFAAALAYTHGIRIASDNAVTLRLNRAECFLRLEWFTCALSDTQYVLDAHEIDLNMRYKAFHRAARAQYGRGQYEKSILLFESCLASKPGDEGVARWIGRSKERLQEAREGVYDWLGLVTGSQTNVHPDIANYQGPVAVHAIQDRGRGMVATKDIVMGELLVCSASHDFGLC